MINQAQQQLVIIAKSEAQSIEEYITDIQQELEILSTASDIQKAIKEEAIFEPLEDSYKDVKKIVDSIYLIDAKGLVIDASPIKESIVGQDFSSIADIKSVLINRQPCISRVFVSSLEEKSIAILQPVYDDQKEFTGILRAVIPIKRINQLATHINQGERGYALVIDKDANILSCRDLDYVGKNMLTILDKYFQQFNLSNLKNVISEMENRKEGADVVNFLSPGYNPKIVKMIVAFSPINIGKDNWSIAAVMNYDAISGPINKNSRENIIFSGFVILIFVFLGISFYRIEMEKSELEIKRTALNIINKELHVEIGERKRIEDELYKSLRKAKEEPESGNTGQ